MNYRIYIIDIYNYNFDTNPTSWEDDKFISESEIQGNVFSLEGFELAFNGGNIDSENLLIRFIKTN